MEDRLGRIRWNYLIGIGLIGLGVLLLLGEAFNFRLGRFIWPFFIIIPGLLLFYLMLQGGKTAGPLAIPASIVTGTGLLLLYQSVFNHWESWAYAWAFIFPTSLGIGLYIHGRWSDNPSVVQTGSRLVYAGVVLLIIGGFFFEIILGISRNLPGLIVWPVVLIVFGVFLVLRQLGVSFFKGSEPIDDTRSISLEVAPSEESSPDGGPEVAPDHTTNEEE